MNANWIDCPVCSSKTRDRIREDIGYKFLEKDSLILLEQIRTLDKQRLQEYMGTFDRRFMVSVDTLS